MTLTTSAHNVRKVERVITAHRQLEGGGFVVRRAFPTRGYERPDPFLMLDEMGPADYAPGEAVGAPDHPHRGFETVTYMLSGEFEHEDSAGHRGVIGAGDVQWMTAGQGVVHSEMPSQAIRDKGGRVHGFQLWVNLPAKDKMVAPRYQEIPKARIPEARTPDGKAHVRVIAGQALGVAARIETRTPITYLDWTLKPGAQVSVPLPPEQRGAVYVFGGSVKIGQEPGQETVSVGDGQLAVLGDGEAVTLAVDADGGDARLLVLAGVPLREPVVQYGPFVMNTKEQIGQAIVDYQEGRLGSISR
ncbi:MAG TPA: pirin family protein [Polyangia bacterium]